MEQADLFRVIVSLLERLGIPYMVVGSFASGAYGEPRLTQDIDIVIDPTVGQLDQLCAAFPPSDFYVSVDAARDALRQHGQFNVIHPDSGNKIDLMIARADEWGRSQLARRRRTLILADQEGFAAAPEDIILSKMNYYREGGSEKHLRDIAGMMKISGPDIDETYVERWAAELDLMDVWRAVLVRLGRQVGE